jgi:hypothetical protein
MSELTSAQLLTLKNDIAADPTFTGWYAQEIANAYNLAASPAWVVWRTQVTPEEWRAAIIGGGGAVQLDALTACFGRSGVC